jgi:hypothetical protein
MKRSAGHVACLLAALATSACTGADGLVPPGNVGTGGPLQPTVGLAPTPPAAMAAGSSAAATVQDGAATQVASAAPAGTDTTPAFAGSEPSASTPQAGGQMAAIPQAARVEFAPVTGATQEAAAPLARQLTERARARGIGIAGSGVAPTHILKGYFSEVSDRSSTTVIYVWDVLDPSGNRLHRIQGSAKTKGAGGWSAVSAKTMQAIANETMDEFARWLSGGGAATGANG